MPAFRMSQNIFLVHTFHTFIIVNRINQNEGKKVDNLTIANVCDHIRGLLTSQINGQFALIIHFLIGLHYFAQV